MYPDLIHFNGYTLHAYYGMLVTAFVVCGLLVIRDGRRYRDIYILPQLVPVVLICALIGARAFSILEVGTWTQLWRALIIWEAGLTFYGGLIGALMGAYIFAELKCLPFVRVADVSLASVPLGEAITRIGCFLSGCCWGTLCSLPWAVSFPKFSPAYYRHLGEGLIDDTASGSLPVHPTQLYFTVSLVALAIILRTVLKRTRTDGLVVGLYFLLYGILRFGLEYLRGDNPPILSFMTISQVVSICLIMASAFIFLRIRSRT